MSWKMLLMEFVLPAVKSWWTMRQEKKRQKVDEKPQDVV